MSKGAKKVLLVAAGLFGLLVVGAFRACRYDEERLRAARNPCESACLQDSGGIEDCRRQCATHPLSYGPNATLPPWPQDH